MNHTKFAEQFTQELYNAFELSIKTPVVEYYARTLEQAQVREVTDIPASRTVRSMAYYITSLSRDNANAGAQQMAHDLAVTAAPNYSKDLAVEYMFDDTQTILIIYLVEE